MFAAERGAEKYVGSRIMTHFLRDRGSQAAYLEPESMKSVLLLLIQSRYRTIEKFVRLLCSCRADIMQISCSQCVSNDLENGFVGMGVVRWYNIVSAEAVKQGQ